MTPLLVAISIGAFVTVVAVLLGWVFSIPKETAPTDYTDIGGRWREPFA